MIVTGKSIVTGVIGDPVSHSRSPLMHNYWLARYGIDGVLIPLHIRPENLATAIPQLSRIGLRGFCVTIPHKEKVIALLDRIDDTARTIGAVNFVSIEKDGTTSGSNTDSYGFIENLKSQTGWQGQGKTALIVGAGGAARAVAHALACDGCGKIIVANRTPTKAERLVSDLESCLDTGFDTVELGQAASQLADVDLIVNTTSLGMAGQAPFDLPIDGLKPAAIVADIVYVPMKTPLLLLAEQNGHRICTGLGMLLHQARPMFREWYGRDPEITDELIRLMINDISKTP